MIQRLADNVLRMRSASGGVGRRRGLRAAVGDARGPTASRTNATPAVIVEAKRTTCFGSKEQVDISPRRRQLLVYLRRILPTVWC